MNDIEVIVRFHKLKEQATDAGLIVSPGTSGLLIKSKQGKVLVSNESIEYLEHWLKGFISCLSLEADAREDLVRLLLDEREKNRNTFTPDNPFALQKDDAGFGGLKHNTAYIPAGGVTGRITGIVDTKVT